jgi:CheY-like chemotaxis protein/DNA-binding XRE family transcriptional regulator
MNKPSVRGEFARALRWWRSRRGFSQERLAERASLHRTYISDVERGARNLSLESISKLADALEIPITTLFSPTELQAKLGNGHADGNGSRGLVDLLLVEDNPDDVEMTLRAFKLSRFANLVHVVRDGEEAQDYLFCRGQYAGRKDLDTPQVVLLDLGLPKISGLELLRRMKADARLKSVPVIVLTVSTSEADLAECRRLGVDAFMLKPVDFRRLTEVTPILSLNWALLKPQSGVRPDIHSLSAHGT